MGDLANGLVNVVDRNIHQRPKPALDPPHELVNLVLEPLVIRHIGSRGHRDLDPDQRVRARARARVRTWTKTTFPIHSG